MKPFETAGDFWLATSEHRVMGLLKYSQDTGFTLEIPNGFLGTMEDFVDRINRAARDEPTVYGNLRDGKCITLVDVALSNAELSAPGGSREIYKSLLGFIGDQHVAANPSADRVQLKLAHLRDWVVRHPARLDLRADGKAAEYRYEAPDDAQIGSGEGWRLVMMHTVGYPIPSVEGFNLVHDCELSLELDHPLAFVDIEERFHDPLLLFLSFCLDRESCSSRLRIREGESSWIEVGRAQGRVVPEDEIVGEPFMLLSMLKLEAHLDGVIGRWVALQGDARMAVSMLVAVNTERSMAADMRFLAAAQALEAMSRVDANEQELGDTEFEGRLAVVREITDPRVRKWALRKLQHANSRSAGDLRRDLANFVGEYVGVLAPDRERFLSDIGEARNFYTHRDGRRASKVLAVSDLYVLTEGIICLLKAATLRRLGYSERETVSLMNDCQGTLHWRHRVSELYALEA